ncbi:MAG: hypothetical protein RL701_6592 [Pseudomonadota bacterium]
MFPTVLASACSNTDTPALPSAGNTVSTGVGGASAAGTPSTVTPSQTAGKSGSTVTGAGGQTSIAVPVAGSAAAGSASVAAGSGSAASGSGAAGVTAQAGTAAAGTTSTPSGAFDYEAQEVTLDADLVVPAGKTVRVGPGTTFKASATEVKIQVLGELVVEGTADKPASFLATKTAIRSWHGLVIESGGKLTMKNAKIGGASYGLWAMPGSQFSVDSSVIDTSFKAAIIQSDGSFTHTRFIASVPETVSLASEVSVDDPNGALTIMDASPTVTDCQFDGASTVTDLVRIGGKASPIFDYVYLHDAHCAFHTYGGTNTSARISHARIENFSYGFMAYTTKPIVENSVFKGNSADFGICLGATADNAPALKNNFYSTGEVSLDPSCFNIGIADAAPAATASAEAGTKLPF